MNFHDGVTVEGLAKLKPAFKKDGTVTAGNASGINDGAAALVLMSKEKAIELGIKPMAIIRANGVAGVDPKIMGIGPVPASKKALEKAGLSIDAIDLIEANEAFASQSLAVGRELKIPRETECEWWSDCIRTPELVLVVHVSLLLYYMKCNAVILAMDWLPYVSEAARVLQVL